MGKTMIKGSLGGTYPFSGSSVSPYSFGSFNGVSSANETTNIGVTIPYNATIPSFSASITGPNGSNSGVSALVGVSLNQVTSQISGYNGIFNTYTLNPELSVLAGDMLNFNISSLQGTPGNVVYSTFVAVVDVETSNITPFYVIIGEQSTNTGTLSGRLSFGAGANNEPQTGIGNYVALNPNMQLVAASHSAKTSSNTQPTGNIVIDMIKDVATVETIIRTDTITSGNYNTHTVLGVPIVFNAGDQVSGRVQSTSDADVVISSYWFTLIN